MMVVALVVLGACGPGSPSGEDITQSIEEELRSVSGDWTGLTPGSAPQALVLNFTLAEAANGQLTGAGKMREGSAPTTIPLTVTGSFQRPVLDLTFDGAVFEGRSVRGTLRGSYTNVGGIISTLELTGDGYTKQLEMLLIETKGSLP